MKTDIGSLPREQLLAGILRAGAGFCFIGHGAFGVITKAEWVPFFEFVGIPGSVALALMPFIGMVDIALGFAVLFGPRRWVLAYMSVWALWTAALRPLSGDSAFEMVERAGNYGVPLAFLVLLGWTRTAREWFAGGPAPSLTPGRESAVRYVLVATTAMLLGGHGALAISQKALLVDHAGMVGVGTEALARFGMLEIALAALVVLVPCAPLLLGVAAWKVATELLFLISGAPVWEFIERAGSYAAPLALAALLARRAISRQRATSPAHTGVLAAAAIALSAVLPAVLGAQEKDLIPNNPPGIKDSLLRGGYVIACRHAMTNADQSDHGPAREQQRVLSAAGEEQAKLIGAGIRKWRIPIDEVRANPMYRNRETAEYAFGKMVVDTAFGGRKAGPAIREFLKIPVPRGTNRAVVARIGNLSGAMQDHGVKLINEGDCFVVQPADGDFKVLARMKAAHWQFPSRPDSLER